MFTSLYTLKTTRLSINLWLIIKPLLFVIAFLFSKMGIPGAAAVPQPILYHTLVPTVIPGVAPDCSDLSTGWSPACFVDEDVTSYLIEYNTTIRLETCAPYQPWTQCFQGSAFSGPGGPKPLTIQSLHNCTYLSLSPTNTSSCVEPQLNTNTTKIWSLGDWYGVWSIYQLQSHVSSWTQALLSNTSITAISNLISNYTTWNASQILATIIKDHSLDPAADSALINLLYAPNSTVYPAILPPQPKVGDAPTERVPLPDRIASPSIQQWQDLLRQRMQEVLRTVSWDFGLWFAAVQGGAFASKTMNGTVSTLRMRMAT